EVAARQQVLVHADGALVLAAAAEQIAQREVQVGGVRVMLYRFDEGIDGLVLLFIEQQVQALEVGLGRSAVLAAQLPQVHARGAPAQQKGKRKGQQQPVEIEFHVR